MKFEAKVNLAPYFCLQFQSDYFEDMKSAAADLIRQMLPYAVEYQAIRRRIAELCEAYGVPAL